MSANDTATGLQDAPPEALQGQLSSELAQAGEEGLDATGGTGLLLCRMYECPLPKPHQIVKGKVTSIRNTEIYVQLEEYDNLVGLLPTSLIGARRVKSITSYVKPGNERVLEVFRVDFSLMHVDLDERSISSNDREECQKRYLQADAIHSLLRQLCLALHIPKLIYAYKVLGWPAARNYDGKIMDAFKKAVLYFDDVFGEIINSYYTNGYVETDEEREQKWNELDRLTIEELNYIRDNIPKETLSATLRDIIAGRLTPKPVRVSCEVKVINLYDIRGIELIKEVLREGQKYASEHPITTPEQIRSVAGGKVQGENHLVIKLLVAPIYSLTMVTMLAEEGRALMENVVNVIKQTGQRLGCQVSVERDITVSEKD